MLGLALLPASGEPSILERERARRASQAQEAREELKRGDAAYEAANFEEAVGAYANARGLLTDSALTSVLRTAATERYAQASVERARQLAKGGRRDDAEALLDSVLASDVLPSYAPAQQLKEQIFDPIRYNPALDAESVREVDEVRRLLYEAEGFTSLGQFDRALEVYEEVLRIDPTNHAARRAMEGIHRQRSDYFAAARDETRMRMLSGVAAAWENRPPPTDRLDDAGMGEIQESVDIGRSAAEKLASMVVPAVDLNGASLAEAIDYLRQQSRQLDTMELDEANRGIGFVIDMGTGDSPLARRILSIRFDLVLRNVPMAEVLGYITSATRTRARIDEHAVVILPEGAISDELTTRRWRVPPDFLSREALDQPDDNDPFAEPAKKKLLGAKLTPKAFLQKQGVPFPEGSSAGFTAFDSTLSVRNTRTNLDFVDQIVDAILSEEPVAVKIEVRFINIAEDELEELGFDWLLNGTGINDNVFLGGGSVGNGTAIEDFGIGLDPVTAGLRSGEATSADNNIDKLIRAGSRSSTATTNQENVRAPGVMSLAGVWGDDVVAVLMRGLNQAKGTDWAVKKSVLTRSGQSATLESVREMIVPTEYEPPEIPNNINTATFTDLSTGETGSEGLSIATPATPTAFEKRKTGCILEVEPLVGPNRQYVEVALKPMIKTFDGFIDYGTPINGGFSTPVINIGGIGNPNVPTFNAIGAYGQITQNSILMPVYSVTQANTNLTILDGHTIVLGGMLTEGHFKYEDKVPVLGDIPLIGRFFQSQSETRVKNALIIFVKVELLDPAGYRYRNR